MDDENPLNPEVALEQLTALGNIPANFRPKVLKRVTAFVKGSLEALIKSQAQLATDRLALEADRQKLVEDTSIVCKAIQDTITTQHEAVTENLASRIAEAHDQLKKCLKLQNEQKVATDDLATGAKAIVTEMDTVKAAVRGVSSADSITKMDEKVNGIATAISGVSSAESIKKVDEKVNTLTAKLEELQLTKIVTDMGGKVDSAVSTFNTARATLDNVKPALDNVNRRFEVIDKAKKSEESSTMGKFDSFQKFLESFAEGLRQHQETVERTTTSRYNAIVATVPVIEGTVVPTSHVIAMELKKDNELLRSENQSLTDKNNNLKQERKRLVTELSGSTSKESELRKERDELKEKFTRTNDSLLATLDAYQKVCQKLLDQDKSKKDAANEQIQGISAQVSQMLTVTTNRVKHLESKVEDLTAKLEAARDDGMVLQLEAEKSKNRIRDYRQGEAIYKSNAKTLETYADSLKDELDEARPAHARTTEELKKMSEAREKEAARVAQLKKDVEAAKDTAHSHKTESDRLTSELETTQTKLQAAQNTSQELKKMAEAREKDAAQVTQLQKDVEAAKDTAHSHKTESDRLTRELETTKTKLQAAQNTSQATQIKLDQELNKLQKANEQLKEMQSKLGEEQEKLREATADLDQKRARLVELEQPGHSPDNPLKRRRSRSPQRDPPTRTDWDHAPEWLMKSVNLIQPCQDAEPGFPSTHKVFIEICSLLMTERSHRALKEFLEYAELDDMYCFNAALDCEPGQKAASIMDEECHVHKDSTDDYCLPVYFWSRNGKEVLTFYPA